jgi:hypothetical protein
MRAFSMRSTLPAALLLLAACDNPAGRAKVPDGCMDAPASLLAWYPFDETSGDTAADLGNVGGRASLQVFSGTHQPGRVLGGLTLAGYDAYAQGSANKNVGTGDFTIALWVRIPDSGPGSYVPLLDKRDPSGDLGYHLSLFSGSPSLSLADGSGEDPYATYYSWISSGVMDGSWHHLAVTVERASNSGVHWYLDGQPAGRFSDPTGRRGSLSNAAPLLIGANFYSGPIRFDGTVDELQIFNRALTASEVSALHTRHLCR